MAETAGEMLQRLGADGKLWAEEFNRTAVSLGYSEMDEGWLTGWFANAIENTCVTRRCRLSEMFAGQSICGMITTNGETSVVHWSEPEGK
jgi:hypothetical protein